MSDIKVLFYVFFPAGGIGRYTHTLLTEMAQLEGVEVEMVCLPEFKWRDNDAYATWPKLFSISNRFVPLRKFRFLLAQFINPRRLLKRARDFRPDIIHICNINHLSFPWWKAGLAETGAKIVATAHDVRRAAAILNRGWEERQLKGFYQAADHLFVHSGAQRADLAGFAGVDRKKVTVVPHGPYTYPSGTKTREELRGQHGIPNEAMVGLFFGQIRDDKNLAATIEAFAQTDSKNWLMVAGKSGANHRGMGHYREVAKRFGVADRVVFLDRFIPDDEVSDLLAMSDYSVLTYSLRFTSQSGVLSSAVAFRKPVLVTSCSTFSEILQDYSIGVVCDGDGKKAIAVGLRTMANRLEQGKLFEFDAYLAATSWRANATKTIAIYRNLVS